MFWIIFICALILLFYIKVKKSHAYWKEKGIKYQKPIFFLGNLNIFTSQPISKTITDNYNTFPDDRYFGTYNFLTPSIMVKDPDLIKQITVKEFESFSEHRPFVPPDLDPFWARNLFAASGARWRALRSTLSPSFTGSKMKILCSLMEECAQQFIEYFEAKAEHNGVQELEMKETLTRFTNDVIASTAFGLKIDSLKDRKNEFYLYGQQVTNFQGINILKFFVPLISSTLSKLLNLKIVPLKVANFFTEIITNTIEQRQKSNIIRPDMIHLLLEAQKGRAKHEEDIKINEGFSTVQESTSIQTTDRRPITNDDIVSLAFGFFFAGFDTVSTAMSFTFYELAVNPDVQSRLRDEILAVEGEVNYEKVVTIKYLDMIISEVLRLWPPTLFTDRVVTKPFTIEPVRPNEIPLRLEVGTTVWIPQYPMQRDPKYFSDPDRFDPERFNDENKHKINPATYIPFGIGPRNCLGNRFALLEIKLILFHTLKSFEIVPVEKTHIPMILDKFTMAPKNGMWLGLKKIS